MTNLLHETFLCQDRLDEIARKRQLLVTKKRGSYAYISYDQLGRGICECPGFSYLAGIMT